MKKYLGFIFAVTLYLQQSSLVHADNGYFTCALQSNECVLSENNCNADSQPRFDCGAMYASTGETICPQQQTPCLLNTPDNEETTTDTDSNGTGSTNTGGGTGSTNTGGGPRFTPTEDADPRGVNSNQSIVNLDQVMTNLIGFNPKLRSLGGIISTLLPIAFFLSGTGVLIFLILGGFKYLTSAGDAKKAEEAKGTITAALIGFFIIIGAFSLSQIINFIFNLGTPGL